MLQDKQNIHKLCLNIKFVFVLTLHATGTCKRCFARSEFIPVPRHHRNKYYIQRHTRIHVIFFWNIISISIYVGIISLMSIMVKIPFLGKKKSIELACIKINIQ